MPSILLMQASISGLYFSTQAEDDAMTANSPKTSTIIPDNLQGKNPISLTWTIQSETEKINHG